MRKKDAKFCVNIGEPNSSSLHYFGRVEQLYDYSLSIKQIIGFCFRCTIPVWIGKYHSTKEPHQTKHVDNPYHNKRGVVDFPTQPQLHQRTEFVQYLLLGTQKVAKQPRPLGRQEGWPVLEIGNTYLRNLIQIAQHA